MIVCLPYKLIRVRLVDTHVEWQHTKRGHKFIQVHHTAP